MRFIAIKPGEMTIESIEAEELLIAQRKVLGDVKVDHGVINWFRPRLSIVVYEFGLFEPYKHRHFSIGAQLFAGRAVIYAFDESGETVSIPETDARITSATVVFMQRISEIEAAIREGRIDRPAMRVNGQLIWEWNKSPPARSLCGVKTSKSGWIVRARWI